MAFSWLHKSSRLLILHFLLCSFLPTASSQSVDPDPECTSDRKGLQACNFNKNKCLQEPSGQEAAWTHTPENGDGPFTPFEKGYIYLDPKKSQGIPKRLIGKISKDISGICVDFFYNSIGKSAASITFFIQEGIKFEPVHTVTARTGGKWLNTSFSCCLPDLQNEKQLAIESTSSDDVTVAIDYLDIRHSNMKCNVQELVCYPTLKDQKPGVMTTVDPVKDLTDVTTTQGKATGSPLEHPTTCPPGYQQLDNHCFLLMPETMTFFEATVACDVVDGKLPEVVSPEDQTRLEKFLTSAGSGVSSNIWLGATDLQQEGTWRYLSTDNEAALSAWSHWAPSYPRVDRSSNCAVLNLPNGWRWQDSACSYNLQVMCEVTLSLDKLVG